MTYELHPDWHAQTAECECGKWYIAAVEPLDEPYDIPCSECGRSVEFSGWAYTSDQFLAHLT